jgi:NDP-sugar pyrophosphorylase family protein
VQSFERGPDSDDFVSANGNSNGHCRVDISNGVVTNGNCNGHTKRKGGHGPLTAGRPGPPRPAAAKTSVTRAVVLAGGRGTRLAPYTSILPKPLMPIGDRSILELVVDQLEMSGINDITFCVGYLSHLIRAVFDHRDNEGVKIDYVYEQEALGTAGPLRLVEGLDETFVAMNGDVLTNLDHADLLRHHQEHGNALTIATHERRIKIDYGVLQLQSLVANGDTHHRITEFHEKPEIVSTVSKGIYAMEPRVIEHVPAGRPFDLPDLVHALLAAGEPVGAYKYDGVWFDIGRKEDYEQAVAKWFGPRNGDVDRNLLTESV